jgi:hypothetical protein
VNHESGLCWSYICCAEVLRAIIGTTTYVVRWSCNLSSPELQRVRAGAANPHRFCCKGLPPPLQRMPTGVVKALVRLARGVVLP